MHRSGSTDGARRNRRGGGESSGEQPLIYRGRVFTIFKFALFSSFAHFLGVCVAASCKSEGSSFRAAARNASFSAGGACSSSCFTGTRACSFFKGGASELKYSRNALIWFSWANRWFSFWTRYAAHPDRPDFPERLFFFGRRFGSRFLQNSSRHALANMKLPMLTRLRFRPHVHGKALCTHTLLQFAKKLVYLGLCM